MTGRAPSKGSFEAVRAAFLHQHAWDINPFEIIAIAEDQSSRAKFRLMFKAINDPNTQTAIKDYLLDVANDLQASAKRTARHVELLDRAGLAPSAAIAVAGVRLTVSTAGIAGPLMLIAGVVAMITSAGGRANLSFRADASELSAAKIKQMLETLK